MCLKSRSVHLPDKGKGPRVEGKTAELRARAKRRAVKGETRIKEVTLVDFSTFGVWKVFRGRSWDRTRERTGS